MDNNSGLLLSARIQVVFNSIQLERFKMQTETALQADTKCLYIPASIQELKGWQLVEAVIAETQKKA